MRPSNVLFVLAVVLLFSCETHAKMNDMSKKGGAKKNGKSKKGGHKKSKKGGHEKKGKGGVKREESFICVALQDLFGDGRSGYPESFENPILAAQPNCKATCDVRSDERFVGIVGLEDGSEPNIMALDDVISAKKMKELIGTFSNMYVMSEKSRKCIMTPELHLTDGLYNASANLAFAIPQFAPPRGDLCERQLGSMGLYYNTDVDAPQSICNLDSPGRQWNTFLLNGQFDELYEECGYKSVTGDGYYADLTSEPGCSAALTGAPCQQAVSQSGGNTDNCYCMYDEGLGLHCPMFGPVYYVNAKAVWNLGGIDYLGRMPGRRVFCQTGMTTDNCTNTCAQASIDDFSMCQKYQR